MYLDRIPTRSDARRGVVPSHSTFIRHFGCMANAYEAADLGKIAREDAA
jgi:hypothetical protein